MFSWYLGQHLYDEFQQYTYDSKACSNKLKLKKKFNILVSVYRTRVRTSALKFNILFVVGVMTICAFCFDLINAWRYISMT
jgi:hypothetical protein